MFHRREHLLDISRVEWQVLVVCENVSLSQLDEWLLLLLLGGR